MSSLESYEFLADYYDALTTDVDYRAWADFLEGFFRRTGNIQTVVDLGCGTGSLLVELAQRGYSVVGVDLSQEMLTVAADKCMQLNEMPLLLCQDMSRLKLLEQADAIVCCLDSLNYVTDPKAVQRTFQQVFANLRPGGLFLFDIRTPEFLQSMDGQTFLDETEEVYCVWRGAFSRRNNILNYCMDLFGLQQNGLWARAQELHVERAYEPEELTIWLKEAGFTRIRKYGNLKLRTPKDGEERIFFSAQKGRK